MKTILLNFVLFTLIMTHDILAQDSKIYNVPKDIKEDIIAKKIWQYSCPVNLERLKIVEIKYYDFNGNTNNYGKIMVLDAVAKRVEKIFAELYERKFPMAKITLINNYNGSDDLSLIDNNSSAFNCRLIAGSDFISIHSYGLAIDINPIENPYITYDNNMNIISILPPEGEKYMDRSKILPHMVEPIVDIFKNNGFTIWGGNWTTPKDWQHFQTTRNIAEILAILNGQTAEDFFEKTIEYPNLIELCNNNEIKNKIITYSKDRDIISFLDKIDLNTIKQDELIKLF